VADLQNIQKHKLDDPEDENPSWIVKLYSYFHQDDVLSLLMEFCPGADLLTMLQKYESFTEEQTRFYATELVLALEFVHKHYGPLKYLKPGNILRDKLGHIKVSLSDFNKITGYSTQHHWTKLNRSEIEKPYDADEDFYVGSMERMIAWNKARSSSFCSLYIAPEIIKQQIMEAPEEISDSCDWWTLGVVMYEMMLGYSPFWATLPEHTYHKIMNWKMCLQFPKHSMTGTAENLIRGLICDRKDRLTVDNIKGHPWFKGLDWNNYSGTSGKVPFMPVVAHEFDTSNFDVDFLDADFNIFI